MKALHTCMLSIFVTSLWFLFLLCCDISTLSIYKTRENVPSVAMASRDQRCCDRIDIFFRPQITAFWKSLTHEFEKLHCSILLCNLLNYEACPQSKDTKFLSMYNIFNLQKRHCEGIVCT